MRARLLGAGLLLPSLAAAISPPDSVWSGPGQWHESLWLYWTPVEGADGYEVYQKPHPSLQDTAWVLIRKEPERGWLLGQMEHEWPVTRPLWSVAMGVRAVKDSVRSELTTHRLTSNYMPGNPDLSPPDSAWVEVEEGPDGPLYTLAWTPAEGADEYGILIWAITRSTLWNEDEWDPVFQAAVRPSDPAAAVVRYTVTGVNSEGPIGWFGTFLIYAVDTEQEWVSRTLWVYPPADEETGATRATWGQVKGRASPLTARRAGTF